MEVCALWYADITVVLCLNDITYYIRKGCFQTFILCTRSHYVHLDLKGYKTTWMQSFSCRLSNNFWMCPEQEHSSCWKRWQSKRHQGIQRIELLRKIFRNREWLLWFAEHLFQNYSGRSIQNLSEHVLTVCGSVKALVHMQILLFAPFWKPSSMPAPTHTTYTHFFRDLSLCSARLIFSSIHLSLLCRGGIRPQEKRFICAVGTAH